MVNQITVLVAAGVTRSAGLMQPLAGDKAKFLPNPYRGLASFFEEDADRFFGRENQVARLWDAFRSLQEQSVGVCKQRILPILGPSGCGKSSLARAGLTPEIARHALPTLQSPRVIVLTPTAHPLDALAEMLAKLVTGDPAPVAMSREFKVELQTGGEFDGLRRIARYVPEIDRRKIVVLIDQFEEVYTLCSDSTEQDAFVGNLLHASRDGSGDISVILTMRTDFIGNTQRQLDLNRVITEQGIIVPAMSADELRKAITQPAVNAGRPLDAALVELLVQDTLGREGALPLLQFALQRLWDAMSEGKDPGETFRAFGGVGGALAQEADQLYTALSPPQQKIVRRAFRSMVQLGEGVANTRRRADLDTIVSKGETRAQVLKVLRAFAQPSKRLVTLEGQGDDVLIEVTHEALIANWEKVREWLGPRQREDVRFHRQLSEAAEEWRSNAQSPDLTWRGFSLGRLQEFVRRTDDDLTETESSFFDASLQAAMREQKGRRNRTRILIATAIVMAALAIFAVWSMQSAIEERDKAVAELLAGGARRLSSDTTSLHDFERAAALALASLAFSHQASSRPRVDALSAIRAALTSLPLETWPTRKFTDRLTLLTDGRLAVGGSDGQIWILPSDRKGPPVVLQAGPSGDTFNLVALPDGRFASGSLHGGIRIWSADANEQPIVLSESDKVTSMTVLADGRLASAAIGKGITIWPKDEKSGPITLAEGETYPRQMIGLPDGGFATADSDDVVRIWPKDGKGKPTLLPSGPDIWSLAVTKDGRLASGGKDGQIKIWPRDGKGGPTILTTGSQITSMALLSDGRLASGGGDGKISIWPKEGTGRPFVLPADENHGADSVLLIQPSVESMVVLPDDRLVSLGYDGTIRVWLVGGVGEPSVLQHGASVLSLAVLQDGRVASGGADGHVKLWPKNLANEPEVLPLGNWVWSLTVLNDGRLAAGDDDGTIKIWPKGAGGQPIVYHSDDDSIRALAELPDGRLASGGEAGIKLWSTGGTGEPQVIDSRAWVISLKVLPDGGLASGDGSRGGFIEVWPSDQPPIYHGEGVLSLAVSADGRLVSGGGGGTVNPWPAKKGEINRLSLGSPIRALAALAGGGLATGSEDGKIRFWSKDWTGEPEVVSLRSAVHALAVLPDGRLIVGTEDGSIRIMLESEEKLIAALCLRSARNLTEVEWSEYLGGASASQPSCTDFGLPSNWQTVVNR